MEGRIASLVEKISQNVRDVRFKELEKVCTHFFVRQEKVAGAIKYIKRPGLAIRE